MTTVTIHPGGADMSATAKQLINLAGGDTAAVRSSGVGLTVTPDLAYLWLTQHLNGHAPPLPAPRTVPADLATTVRQAETDRGLTDPRPSGPSTASAAPGTSAVPGEPRTGGRAPRRKPTAITAEE